ncbi:MAG: protein translocase subunit SecD [Patescibacteria group bacterium]
MSRSNSFFFLMLVSMMTFAGVLFVYPGSPYASFMPWKLGLDLVGGTYLVYEVDMSAIDSSDRSTVMNGLRDVIEKRVNLFGVSEPRITVSQAKDGYRLNVELAGIKDVKEAIKQIGETPFLVFSEIAADSKGEPVKDKDGQLLFKTTELTGRYVKRAQLVYDNVSNLPQVSLEFNSEGGDIFERVTGRNVGKPVAIFLDGNIISAPRVTEKIIGGKAQITGDFTLDEAKKLVERFNAGALPAPIKLVNQQTVSATLGQDSLQKTIKAGIWGTLAIALFMILYYHVSGLFAAVALFIYVVLALSVFKLFVTMTLAGIAGFILSIGMAVDANILIFERFKEELKKGASKLMALEQGFKRAWPSIRDSNLTTILTTLILYNLTSGFVKGFALTLLFGVLISMFTAITVTRNLLRVFIK